MEADVICLQETWCQRSDPPPLIPGYTPFFAGQGKGKGVATYVKTHLIERKILLRVTSLGNDELYQGLKLYFQDLHVINIYRPPKPTSVPNLDQFLRDVKDSITPTEQTVICGDFNFNILKEPKHRIAVMLNELGFKQIVREPTTIYGSCLDHIYLRSKFLHKYALYHPYYSDHECVCLMMKKPVLFNQ